MRLHTPTKRFPVLYVGEKPEDHLLLHGAVWSIKAPFQISSVMSLEMATAYLQREAPFKQHRLHPRPALLLMDAEVEGLSGIGLVRWIRGWAMLRHVPVVVFSGAKPPAPVAAWYQNGASVFLRKAANPERAEEIIEALWRCVASRPLSFEAVTTLPEYRPDPAVAPCPRAVCRVAPPELPFAKCPPDAPHASRHRFLVSCKWVFGRPAFQHVLAFGRRNWGAVERLSQNLLEL